MKIQVFKQIIKEAVIEAINEELPGMVNEILSRQNKQSLHENKTINFTSNDINPSIGDIRSSLRDKMGAEFGFKQPQHSSLKVIDAIDNKTGERINPYLNFIEDAAANMTPMDRSGLRQLD